MPRDRSSCTGAACVRNVKEHSPATAKECGVTTKLALQDPSFARLALKNVATCHEVAEAAIGLVVARETIKATYNSAKAVAADMQRALDKKRAAEEADPMLSNADAKREARAALKQSRADFQAAVAAHRKAADPALVATPEQDAE